MLAANNSRKRTDAPLASRGDEHPYRRQIDYGSRFTRFLLTLRRSTANRHIEVFGSPVEGEPVSAICRGLIVPAIYCHPREVAIEQGSRAAMPDNGDVHMFKGFRHGQLDGADNPYLGIHGRLPAPDAL